MAENYYALLIAMFHNVNANEALDFAFGKRSDYTTLKSKKIKDVDYQIRIEDLLGGKI